jgi:hypothetical protein
MRYRTAGKVIHEEFGSQGMGGIGRAELIELKDTASKRPCSISRPKGIGWKVQPLPQRQESRDQRLGPFFQHELTSPSPDLNKLSRIPLSRKMETFNSGGLRRFWW